MMVGNPRRHPTDTLAPEDSVEAFLLTVAIQLAIALIDLTIQLMRKKLAARGLAPA